MCVKSPTPQKGEEKVTKSRRYFYSNPNCVVEKKINTPPRERRNDETKRTLLSNVTHLSRVLSIVFSCSFLRRFETRALTFCFFSTTKIGERKRYLFGVLGSFTNTNKALIVIAYKYTSVQKYHGTFYNSLSISSSLFVAFVQKPEMVLQTGQSVRANNATPGRRGNADARRDAIADSIEVFDAFNCRSWEHFRRRDDGAVGTPVPSQPFFVRRWRGEEF